MCKFLHEHVFISLGYRPGEEFLSHLCLTIYGMDKLLAILAVHFPFPSGVCEHSTFPVFSTILVFTCLLDYTLPSECEAVFPCGFALYFLKINNTEHI